MNNPPINVNWVPGITLDEMEKNCILAAFRFYRGNKTQTAGSLKIAIRTLESKLEQYETDKLRDQERAATDREEQRVTLERMRGTQLTKQFAAGSSHQWTEDAKPNVELDAEGAVPGPTLTSQELGAFSRGSEGHAKADRQNDKGGDEAGAGPRLEPVAADKPKPPLPMPQRKKVQKLLPKQSRAGGNKRGR
jgi:hypothetical protein